jgi:hypothetical protein
MKFEGKFGCKNLHGLTEMGPFWLSRKDKTQIQTLDNTSGIHRLNPKKEVWYLVPFNYRPTQELKDIKKGLIAMVIGKGPSLDHLTKEDYAMADVLIACNNAVHKVVEVSQHKCIYNVQCDPVAKRNYNPFSTPVILANCAHFYNDAHLLYVPNPKELDIPTWTPVGCLGVGLAKYLGCSRIIMAAFDGAFLGKITYANCVKDSLNQVYTDQRRFLNHRQALLNALNNVEYTVFTPAETGRETLTSCIPPQ